MLIARMTRSLCSSCQDRLLSLFLHGFSCPPQLIRNGSKQWLEHSFLQRQYARSFTQSRHFRVSVKHSSSAGPYDDTGPKTVAQMEAIVRHARQTFGETLPKDFLSPEEFKVYERLYGPPSAVTRDEDLDLLADVGPEDEDVVEDLPNSVLMREDKNGELEEVMYEDEGDEIRQYNGSDMEDLVEGKFEREEGQVDITQSETREEFHARIEKLRTSAAARTADARANTPEVAEEEEKPSDDFEGTIPAVMEKETVEDEALGEEDDIDEHGDSVRTHPLTATGRFGTSPGTIHLPKATVVDPISHVLAPASNKHITEAALKVFGGDGLPNLTTTIKRPNLKQEPIGLEASQTHMGEMEGNAFLAAFMPGAYAAVLSTVVELRKRLGSEWLRGLMRKPGGPRILDAGAGGAGVLAWREILRAEWESLYPGGVPHYKSPPYGKSTVVTGSPVLRHKASKLLDNTTFIPRLPDYDPSRDHPSLEGENPQPRKQYDVIVAPHTLWTLKEDYMRKNQIQNFWSLLDPKGGVLLLIEKGVPRGFELIAGARETLLKHHVSSSNSEEVEYAIENTSENRFGPKEKGMIIAPCTSHGKCPMYIQAGSSQGRKDYCHFSQRFIRPPYLQRILNAKDRNHEDIKFSYVAFQRGVDLRQDLDFEQGHTAAEAAFKGYEEGNKVLHGENLHPGAPSPLTFPRAILPPIKRRGHVILDLCTPAGKIERWTVPKSFSKQAYRDARKSKWGDLWALGAKTRIRHNIRVGLNKAKSEVRSINMDRPDDPDEHDRNIDLDDLVFGRQKKSKKSKNKKRILMDHDD